MGKNKDEGTELFQGQNFRPAAARYNKALTHAAKFHDLSPEQTTEVTATKVSLHLNVAMCWLKITDAPNKLEQAIRSCEEALKLDGDNADLKKCEKLAPEDKMVPKFMARVDAQIKR